MSTGSLFSHSVWHVLNTRSFEADALRQNVGMEAILEDIQFDLMNLLNTKRPQCFHQSVAANIQQSLLQYGLPDLTLFNPSSDHDKEKIRQEIAQTITAFEPRLEDVFVSVCDNEDQDAPLAMSFVIHAMLRLDAERVHVAFDSLVQPLSDRVDVSVSQDNI